MNNMISLKSISNKVLDALEAHFKDSGYNRYAINREDQYGIAEIITHSGTYHAKYYFSPLRDEFCLDITLPVIIPVAYMASAQIYLSEKTSRWHSGCAHLNSDTGTVNLHSSFNLTAVKRRINDFQSVLDEQFIAEEEKSTIMNACISAVLPSQVVIEYMELELLCRMFDLEGNLYRIAAGLLPLDGENEENSTERKGQKHCLTVDPSKLEAEIEAAIKRNRQSEPPGLGSFDKKRPVSSNKEKDDTMESAIDSTIDTIDRILSLLGENQNEQEEEVYPYLDDSTAFDEPYEAEE